MPQTSMGIYTLFNKRAIRQNSTQCVAVLQCYSSQNDGTKVKSNTYIYIYYNIYKYKVEFEYRNTLLENCNTVTA